MTAGVDRRGKFWNQIDESEVNRGSHSKLNGDQTRERAKLHAMRLSMSKPTIGEIAEYWFTQYGIKIHYNSEKEWAWRNEATIIDTMNRMMDSGELKLAINDTSLVNTLNISGVETGRLVRDLTKKLKHVLSAIDFNFDPLAKVGYKAETYKALSEEECKAVDRQAALELTRNKLRVAVLETISNMLKDHKLVLIKTVEATRSMFDDAKLKKREIEAEVGKQVTRLADRDKQLSDFNPVEVEVDDDMRNGVTGGTNPG